MKRLGHRAEVHADAACHARRDPDGAGRVLPVEPEDLGGACRRAEGANRARGVEAALVVVGLDRFGDLALDLEAGQEGFQELRPGDSELLPGGERRRERRHRRMRQEAEDPVRRARELRVVVIERVPRRRVCERREPRGSLHRVAPEHGGLRPARALSQLTADDAARLGRAAGQDHRAAVDQAAPALADHGCGKTPELCPHDEVDRRLGCLVDIVDAVRLEFHGPDLSSPW